MSKYSETRDWLCSLTDEEIEEICSMQVMRFKKSCYDANKMVLSCESTPIQTVMFLGNVSHPFVHIETVKIYDVTQKVTETVNYLFWYDAMFGRWESKIV